MSSHAVYRPVSIRAPAVEIDWDDRGIWNLRSSERLAPYPARVTDRLISGAREYPDRTLVAQRARDGSWVRMSYREMLAQARRIGQALLDRGLSAERPLVILSGNDLEHLQLAMAAMYAGIPYAPVSPAYSLIATDFGKIAQLLAHLTPGMVYATDGEAFTRAILAAVPRSVEVVTGHGQIPGRDVTSFSALASATPSTVDAANGELGPDTIAKFLFTSGSASQPKAVITTHRMLCVNQQMLLQTFPCFGEEPPVLVDWLPWNHTFGGSHNVGIALYNGGTLYIDDGRPTASQFGRTIRNLREISPTVFFNVPKGWELLADALEDDEDLRCTFFARVKLFFFAGAGLSQAVWDRLDAVAEKHLGARICVMSGLGMTEASPSCTFTTGPLVKAGYVGLPAPSCELKLVPTDGKLEARAKGPHIMPGYWRAPEQTVRAFDGEGYYCTGDAVRFHDPEQPEIGLMFDGRLAEDFKLSSGTFVSVGPLRARVTSAGVPYVEDVVITGINRDSIGLLIFPRMEHCRRLVDGSTSIETAQVLAHANVRRFFTDLLRRLNDTATGSASRIDRILLMDEPASIDHRELTDKGSINHNAVLSRRAALVDALYADAHPGVIRCDPPVANPVGHSTR